VVEPTPLRFQDSAFEVPSIATWINGQLIYSFELKRIEDDDPEISEMVLDQPKLCLYRGAETQEHRYNVEKLLKTFPGNKTYDNLLEDLFAAVYSDCRKALLKTDQIASFDRDVLAAIQWRVRISVPHMWTPEARRRMQLAAKKAGLPLVTLASEPQSAMACFVDRLAKRSLRLPKRLERGHKILVMDLGCGTGDQVLFELLDDLSVDSRLDAISQATGALCGSSQIDRLVVEALIESQEFEAKGGLEALARGHGQGPHVLRRRLLNEIAEAKPFFDGHLVHDAERQVYREVNQWRVVKGGPNHPPLTFKLTM